ncbi:MAG: hypothetical protein HFG45_06710 [Oscillospiraceae bacterium]|jgi:hypothetical protein|nr:hypothetical protein [Oscillospiraceae bacterium]
MFELVNEAECRRYRSDCSVTLKQVCSMLKKKGISAQFTLVGSGARNMVTRNGDGPFDLDYNLEIIKATDEYWNDLRHLKDTVRVSLDKATGIKDCFSESNDSTSCLTAVLHFKDESTIEFKFDVAIVKRNSKGSLCKLVHNKDVWGYGKGQYTWIEIPDSHDVEQKAQQIKSKGLWHEVRTQYVDLKNMYLSRQDKDHPSFVVYVEAVNQIYDKYFHQNVSSFRKTVVIKLR